MRTKAFRVSFILLVALLLLLPLVSLGAAPTNQAPEGGDAANVPIAPLQDPNAIITAPDTAGVNAVHEWTAEEMKNAIPYPMPAAEGKDLAKAGLPAAQPEGPAGAVPGFSGEATDALDMPGLGGDLAVVAGSSLLGYSYPGPFARYRVDYIAPVTWFPWRTVGKLYFTQRDWAHGNVPTNYVASASAIGPLAIWTAGHVVHNASGRSDGWSYNIVFVPAKLGASEPYGHFHGRSLQTFSAWYSGGQLGRDFGWIGCYRDGAGRGVGQVVGYLGYAWNQGYQQQWTELGYPQASPFNGLYMWAVNSSFAYNDYLVARSPQTMGVGNDMTGGCSGGPWIKSFGSGNYINGVNSYKYTTPAHPLEMFSPYADSYVGTMFGNARAYTY